MPAKKDKPPEATNDNTKIWDATQTTDAKYVKAFNRGGGFKGTAINPTYLAKKATEIFGPIGTGWGIEVKEENYVTGAPNLNGEGSVLFHDIIHVVLARFWYLGADGEVKEYHQYGQTTFVGKNKNGPFTDEEAPKKSLTDAMSKCLSLLGFSSDVHLGLWDDNKYVNDRNKEAAEEKQKTAEPVSVPDDLKAEIDEAKKDIEAAIAAVDDAAIDQAKAKATALYTKVKKTHVAEARTFGTWVQQALTPNDDAAKQQAA